MISEKAYVVDALETFLRANLEDDYQELVINLNRSFLSFLYRNRPLINLNPFNEDGTLDLNRKYTLQI